jgi:hypothetical protein
MTQPRGKYVSLENVGTINLLTATIRRMDDSAPVLADVAGYPDTRNIYHLITAEFPETRDIIVEFHCDRYNMFGFSNSTQVPSRLRSIRNSLVLIAVNHSAKYATAPLSPSPLDLSTPHVEPTNVFDLRIAMYSLKPISNADERKPRVLRLLLRTFCTLAEFLHSTWVLGRFGSWGAILKVRVVNNEVRVSSVWGNGDDRPVGDVRMKQAKGPEVG